MVAGIYGRLEKMPVIAADSYGPGTLIEQRETGILVPVDDAKTMALAIRKLLEDDKLRSRIAKGGNKVYKKKFTEKIVVGQYMDFFKRLMEEKA